MTSALQVVMVEFLGEAMHVVDGGLDWKHWALSVGIGAFSLPVQQLINVVYRLFEERCNKSHCKKLNDLNESKLLLDNTQTEV